MTVAQALRTTLPDGSSPHPGDVAPTCPVEPEPLIGRRLVARPCRCGRPPRAAPSPDGQRVRAVRA